MEGPAIDFRQYLAHQLDEPRTENEVEGLLGQIEEGFSRAASVDDADQNPHDLLAAIESWMSLASYVVGGYYSPASRRGDIAGWRDKAVEKLRSIADVARSRLDRVKREMGATGFSISVGFPWGISVGLTW